MTLAARGARVHGRLGPIDRAFARGQICAICGPNGAGKSTLLAALAGLVTPDAGQVLLEDRDLARLPPRERGRAIGFLPQTPTVAWDVPVRRIVELGRLPHGDADPGPVDRALAALDLESLADRRAQSLSGGETARVLLARVLAGEPRWILADEPLAALDLSHQLALLSHLRRAASEGGAGVVLVLHDIALAMNHADRVLVLEGGAVVADGAPAEALAEDVIARVWGIDTRWLGDPGAMALRVAPLAGTPTRPR